MDRPGIVVRGLRQISGSVEFNEVFLDDVVVGAESVIGAVDEGWGVALTTLGFERLAIDGVEDRLDLKVIDPHQAQRRA